MHGGYDQPDPELGHLAVTEVDHFIEVVAGVHVHDGKGDPGRPEGLRRKPQHDDGIFAAGEQQHRPLEFGGNLAHHMDGLGLKDVEL